MVTQNAVPKSLNQQEIKEERANNSIYNIEYDKTLKEPNGHKIHNYNLILKSAFSKEQFTIQRKLHSYTLTLQQHILNIVHS